LTDRAAYRKADRLDDQGREGFGCRCYIKQKLGAIGRSPPIRGLKFLNPFPMPTIRVVRRSVIAVAAIAALGLTGCSGTQEAAKQAGDAATTAATTAATATGQAALGQAVTPVIDLLKKSEGEVKAGNIASAVAAMGGFQALWNTASPVIKPIAGDKWPLINTAANLVLSTFAKGATPTPATASSALTGLIGPLSALLMK
jgi:hypothetical protein